MSSIQIPNLPAAISLSGTEELEIVQAGVSVRTTTQAVANLAPVGNGGRGYYGAFYDTTTQTASSPPGAIALGSTYGADTLYVSLGSRINFPVAGTYCISYSVQLTNTENNVIRNAQIWFVKNGVNLDYSNSSFDIPGKHSGKNGTTIATADFIFTFIAGDYIELYWIVDSANVKIETLSAGTYTPVSPGVVVNVTNIRV